MQKSRDDVISECRKLFQEWEIAQVEFMIERKKYFYSGPVATGHSIPPIVIPSTEERRKLNDLAAIANNKEKLFNIAFGKLF